VISVPNASGQQRRPSVNGHFDVDERAAAVGAQVRARREARGISLRRLARECDLSPAHLSKLERGLSRPSFEVLLRLVQKLELYDVDLFGPPPAPAKR
jgi:transcriptional regulator with XRE-family HTH domain